jgi:hypothetical protein
MRLSAKILSTSLFVFFGQAQASVSTTIAEISTFYINIFCHELGHATVAKLAFNDPINIQAGIVAPISLVDNPKAKIKIGLLPVSGFAQVNNKALKTKTEKLKMLAVILAGPISGFSSSLILKKIIEKCLPITNLTTTLLNVFKQLAEASWFDLVPFKVGTIKTDGWQAIKLLFSLTNNKEITL